ncbi:gtf2h4 [Symbiodinium necroappetens]|uniref:General transcription factor IIH subunit 4 n=1 Tax=Symbiodinium necroappetens TaxID=1628268 RepID=A0A812SRZ0_9DINO|nr:gtf2h4 [Symbiodinium necroappetens]
MSSDSHIAQACSKRCGAKVLYVDLVSLQFEEEVEDDALEDEKAPAGAPGPKFGSSRRVYICVGQSCIFLLRASMSQKLKAYDGQIDYVWMEKIVQDTSSRSRFLLALNEKRPKGSPSQFIVDTDNRDSLLTLICTNYVSDCMQDLGSLNTLPFLQHSLATSPAPSRVAAPKGFKMMEFRGYTFFIRQSFKEQPSKISKVSTGHFKASEGDLNLGERSWGWSRQGEVELFVNVVDPIPLSELIPLGREHVRWVAMECKASLLKSWDSVVLQNSPYTKKMNLANDIAAWSCWQLAVRDQEDSWAILVLRHGPAWGQMAAAVKESACSSLSHVGQILFEYVSELSRAELDKLYADAPSVRVIFREAVPPVAQQLVMRLLLGGARPFQESVLKRWCATLSALPHSAYLSVLQRLQILLPQKAQKPGQAPVGQLLMLHKTFQGSLSAYLQGAEGLPRAPASAAEASPEVLEEHAVASWERFLGELLDPDSESLLADLASVLNFKGSTGGLTAAGFQFVLDERQQQLWRLVISFLKKDEAGAAGAAGANGAADRKQQALQALLAIGELGLGEPLTSSAPRPFLRFLVELGVLYEAGPGTAGTGSFLTTPAALALFRRDVSQRLSRSTGGSEAGESQGLIVESNFKVYGYISSPLQARLLGHFCEILVKLPNLVVGQLTAESVLKAMSQGIRAAHMLRYLEAAAHPQQRRSREAEGNEGGNEGSVPSNVCGQLEVWESSRSRAASSSAVLFEWSAEDCEDTFEEAKKLAEAQGALLWSRGREADRAPVLVVRPEAAARLRDLLGVAPPKPPKPVQQPASAAFARSLNPSKRLKLEKDL